MRELVELLAVGLGGWRIASLLTQEVGPGQVFLRLRRMIGIRHDDSGVPSEWPETFQASLLSCIWCTSIWTTLFLWGIWQIEPKAVLLLGAMGIALLTDKMSSK